MENTICVHNYIRIDFIRRQTNGNSITGARPPPFFLCVWLLQWTSACGGLACARTKEGRRFRAKAPWPRKQRCNTRGIAIFFDFCFFFYLIVPYLLNCPPPQKVRLDFRVSTRLSGQVTSWSSLSRWMDDPIIH